MLVAQLEVLNKYKRRIAVKNEKWNEVYTCHFHKTCFVIDERGQICFFGDQSHKVVQVPINLAQVVDMCANEEDYCSFFVRTGTNEVLQYRLHMSERQHKRAKMDIDGQNDNDWYEKKVIQKSIVRMFVFRRALILIPEAADEGQALQYDLYSKEVSISENFRSTDVGNVYVHQNGLKLDSALLDYFGIEPDNDQGLLYGTSHGKVLWRSLSKPCEDVVLFAFRSPCEKLKSADEFSLTHLVRNSSDTKTNGIVLFGDRGTIVCFQKLHDKERGVSFNEFTVSGPIHAVTYCPKQPNLYWISSRRQGRMSLIKIDCAEEELTLDNIPVYGLSNVYSLKHYDSNSLITYSERFDQKPKKECCVAIISQKVKFLNSEDVSADLAEALIADRLEDLAEEESSIKALKQQEEEMNERLVFINRILYALRAINEKRRLGECNSLETTGFEFIIRPVIKSDSSENRTFTTKAFLRFCIKTSPFLELEGWTLCLKLMTAENTGEAASTSSMQHVIEKQVPVLGFLPSYENGIERYVIWERDIEIDIVDTFCLPLQVKTSLMMFETDTDGSAVEFPVSDTVVDHFHFIFPCDLNTAIAIERRGLQEVTERLYIASKAEKWSKALQGTISLKDYKMWRRTTLEQMNDQAFHIKYTTDADFSEESYRSLLSTIIGEGHTSKTIQSILRDGAEKALFLLAAYPGTPIVVNLSRNSLKLLDFSIRCCYTPALLQAQATLKRRIQKRVNWLALVED